MVFPSLKDKIRCPFSSTDALVTEAAEQPVSAANKTNEIRNAMNFFMVNIPPVFDY